MSFYKKKTVSYSEKNSHSKNINLKGSGSVANGGSINIIGNVYVGVPPENYDEEHTNTSNENAQNEKNSKAVSAAMKSTTAFLTVILVFVCINVNPNSLDTLLQILNKLVELFG